MQGVKSPFVVVQMRNVPPPIDLCIWIAAPQLVPLFGKVVGLQEPCWEKCTAEIRLWVFIALPHFLFSLAASWVWMKMWSAIFLSCCAMPSLPWWTLISLESQIQIDLFVPKLLVSGYYNTATEKLLIHPFSSQILIDYPITLFGSFFPWSSRRAHKKGRQSKCTIIFCYSDTKLSKDADLTLTHLCTEVAWDFSFRESKSTLRDALRISNHKNHLTIRRCSCQDSTAVSSGALISYNSMPT